MESGSLTAGGNQRMIVGSIPKSCSEHSTIPKGSGGEVNEGRKRVG
jgi:hypothetical protein